ncbi:MAG: hypothetical protein HC834_00795, partial [Rhodospirillales bacterium]|nr:hypothetical protein [Rhodospirillales bacterium]
MSVNTVSEEDTLAEASEGEADLRDAGPINKKKWLIVSAAVFLALSVGVGGAYCAGLFGKLSTHPDGSGGESVAAADRIEPTYWAAPDLVVSLNSGERRVRYLKVRATLEIEDPADAARLEMLLS